MQGSYVVSLGIELRTRIAMSTLTTPRLGNSSYVCVAVLVTPSLAAVDGGLPRTNTAKAKTKLNFASWANTEPLLGLEGPGHHPPGSCLGAPPKGPRTSAHRDATHSSEILQR